MKRRSIAWFMAVLMTVVLGLGMSLAAAAADDDENTSTDNTPEGSEEWQLWVGNLQITEENKDQYITVTETDESGNTVEKGVVYYSSARNILELRDLTGVAGTREGCAIYYTGEDALRIRLSGSNTIEVDAAGIVSLKGDITLTGSGSLTLIAGESAIRSAGNVTLGGDTVALTAKGGTADDSGVAVVLADGNVSCSTSVTIDGTKVGYGIKAGKDVSVSGNKVDISGMVYGVYAGENISVSGNDNTVTIEAVGETAVEAVTAGGEILLESNQYISVPELGTLDEEAKHIVESDNAAAKKAVIKGKKTYPVYVGGIQVTEDNCDNIPVAEGKASFDPEQNTLHLENARVTAENGSEAAISGNSLKIVLSGKNTVEGNMYGISVGNLVIAGDGELQVSGDKSAIYAFGDLTIESGVKITATARKTYAEEDYAGAIYNIAGSIYCKGDIVAVGGGSGIITISGDIVISSGSVVASGKRFGIDASMGIRISGENTTVTAEISGDYTSSNDAKAYVMIAGDKIEISDNLMIQTPEETKLVSVEHGEQTIVDKDENLPLKVVIVPTVAAEPTATPVPTETPAATATPVPTATVAPTEAPAASATPVPTATITPTPADGGEGQAPNTADNSSMTLWAVLVLVSAAFTAVLLIRKRKSAN